MASIFKPRTLNKQTTPVKPPSKSDISSNVEELTKNKHYCVSRLPGLPQILKTEQFNNAYSDLDSSYSLVINDDSIYVWSYRSIDTQPFSIHFPIDKSIYKLPMAILTRPSCGTDQDPGLIIIDSITGFIKYYESVQHAPTLGLINDKSLELQINLHKDEVITLAENVEPSGICIATSLQRCLMISLRDYKSKPNLSYMELINPNSGILSKFFSREDNEIVAIRSGNNQENQDLTSQQILILDFTGTLYSIYYCLLSANAHPYIDKQKSFKQSLYVDVETYPGSQNTVKWLDIWPLTDKNYYLALCYLNGKLLLVTLGCDNSGAIFYGAHQLNSIEHIPNKPRLFLPKPGKTAFVIADENIIMTDINTSYIESKHTFSYYKPRWEDIIRLRESTEIIGYGYENQSPISNPSIILITKEFGVLRIEKFPETSTTKTTPEELNNPLFIVKSHIEQGIFYSDSMEIDFDLSNRFDSSVIEKAIELITNEIMTSQSAYIPKSLPSITEITQFKIKIFKELINYCKRNFNNSDIIVEIVEDLEKSNLALNLWKFIDSKINGNNNDKKYFEIFKKLKPDYRDFFTHDITNINELFLTYLDKLVDQGLFTGSLIVSALYDGVYANSITYADEEEADGTAWIFDTNLLIKVESIFNNDYVKGTAKDGNKEEILKFVELLYYFFNLATKITEEEDYTEIYYENKQDWINLLINLNLENDAINIAEKYRDFKSLAEILSSQKDTTPINELKYIDYFEKFGYQFASAVYENELQNNRIQELILNFTNYKHYLLQYFHENPASTASVSWIRYILDEKYTNVSEDLQRAQLYNDQTVDNQVTQLSIAKLSAIASNEATEKINANLLKLKYQISIRNQITNNSRIEAIKSPFFSDHFLNPKIDSSYKKDVVNSYFPKLQKNKRLNDDQLIDLLTTIKPSILKNNNFYYAFKVALFYSRILDEGKLNLILLRLLTLSTDSIDTKLSDKELNSSIKSSAVFKAIHNQPELIKMTYDLVNHSPVVLPYSKTDLAYFNDSLLQNLQIRLKDKQFVDSINSIIEQAKIVPI
ncbi:NUP133 [Candida jiufengensis]|uniref:NUP133 n=1 Tax=Candida jiufengensis TaxID=497108 RepID=UPI0022253A3E|nr:NUP133 [Candida jiufengensis]KAI5951416.1 NUP133 [Candida jiufengensis]